MFRFHRNKAVHLLMAAMLVIILGRLISFILVGFSMRCATELHISNPNIVVRKEDLWEALNSLNGSLFQGDHVPAYNCSTSSISFSNTHMENGRQHKFTGTQLFSHPQEVDLLEKICQFQQGQSILQGSYRRRNFTILINHPNICNMQRNEKLHLIVLIKSKPSHTMRRMLIRRYWANTNCWAGRNIRRAFLLGTTVNQTAMIAIEAEARKYEDILQQDFVDRYRNLTLKVFFGLQWAIAFCPETKWLLMLDDDIFVHTRNVLPVLDLLNSLATSKLLIGNFNGERTVLRNRSKWMISRSEYAHVKYPIYSSGAWVVIGRDLALELYIASRFTRMIPFDDAYIGLLLNKLLYIPVSISGIYLHNPRVLKRRELEDILAIHGVTTVARQKRLWILTRQVELCTSKPGS
ncbi:unnamed protein product [Dicrocoelium dendriticum]|nr:unnamed protein product [Dicrocoelium dendriticum]